MLNIWIFFKKILICFLIYKLNLMLLCLNMSWVILMFYVLIYWNINRVLNSWCVFIKFLVLIWKVVCGKVIIRCLSKLNNKFL